MAIALLSSDEDNAMDRCCVTRFGAGCDRSALEKSSDLRDKCSNLSQLNSSIRLYISGLHSDIEYA